jgi:alpha-glucan phosphorylase-like protein
LNNPWDRGIAAHLYAAAQDTRFLQELVLGVGGWQLLEKLGIEVDVCHLNEGHAALATLARATSFAKKQRVPFQTAWWATRAGNVFTTHTPIEAAFDRFNPELVLNHARAFFETLGVPARELLDLGRMTPGSSEPFNMAYLAARGCSCANGVSQLHGAVSRELFAPLFPRWPLREVPIQAITNGVHVGTWDSEAANGQSVRVTHRADALSEGGVTVNVHVLLGELAPNLVRVQLYADARGGQGAQCIECQLEGPLPGSVNGFQYVALIPQDRSPREFTSRVVPHHPDAFIPLEAHGILWA